MTHPPTFRDLERGRANNFDALRLGLALLVILSHSPFLLFANGYESELLFRATGGQLAGGPLAVYGFFLISGYLIAASWQRSRGPGDYLRRRALRIFPGFLVAVAFSSLVAGPLLAGDRADFWRHFDVARFLKEAFGLVGAYTPAGGVNGSLWTIRYEFHCYLGLAAFGLLGILRRRALVVAFVLLCTGLSVAIQSFGLRMPGNGLSWLWGYPPHWPPLAANFFAGAAFHLYADRIARSGRLALACLAGLLLAAFVPGSRALPFLIPYLGGYLIFYLAFLPAGGLKDIAKRGDLSYGLYLYSFPIQLLLVRWYGPRLTAGGLAMVSAMLSAIFALFSWHCVERPFLTLKRGVPRRGPVHEESVLPPPVAVDRAS